MDFIETWENFKSLLTIAKTGDEEAAKKFLSDTCLPTESLTNSEKLSKMFAFALNIKNFEALEILIKHGVRALPVQEISDNTYLQSAVLSGNVKLVSEMIEYGADFNVRDKDGNTLLHLVFKNSKYGWDSTEAFDSTLQRDEAEKLVTDILDVLIDSGLNVNAKNEKDETTLSLAVKYRNVKITDYLLKRNAELNIFGNSLSNYLVQDEINSSDEPKDIHDHQKVSKNQRNIEFMNWWFSKKIDLDRKCSGMTPLQLSVRHILKDVLLILINYIDKIDSVDENGENLLHTLLNSVYLLSKKNSEKNYAGKCLDIVKVLMDKGVSVNQIDNNGYTPFHIAASLNNPKVMQMMLKNFTEVNACDYIKQSPLHLVIKNCMNIYHDQYLLIVSSLVTKGADINKQDRTGMTPLHYACANGSKASKAIIEFFADQGCDLNIVNSKGETPLHMCVNKDRLALLQALINRGANVNLKFMDKRIRKTALHKATENQLSDAVEMLIKAGANPDEKDGEGNTALQIDLDIGGRVLTKLLEMGADLQVRSKPNNWSLLRTALHKEKPYDLWELLKFGATITDIDRRMLSIDYFDIMGSRGQATAKGLIVLHLMSLKVAGLPVPIDYDRIIQPYQQNLEALIEQRTKELEALQNKRIDNIAIYDFLHMSMKLRYFHLTRKANLRKFLSNYTALQKDFPCYSQIISAKYWTVVHRMPLLDSAKNAWYHTTDFCLPEMYVENILSYLQNSDLRSVIEAGS